MTWTRVCLTEAQIAAGDGYRLQRKFAQLYARAPRTGMAMFTTVFLRGQQAALYFSPAVLAEAPTFTAEAGASACERPEVSVALCVGAVGARDLLTAS